MESVNALLSHYDTLSFTTSFTDYLMVCISRLMGSVNALPSDYDKSSFTTSFTDYLTVFALPSARRISFKNTP